ATCDVRSAQCGVRGACPEQTERVEGRRATCAVRGACPERAERVEGRGPESGVRRLGLGARVWRWECGVWRVESGGGRWEFGVWSLECGVSEFGVRSSEFGVWRLPYPPKRPRDLYSATTSSSSRSFSISDVISRRPRMRSAMLAAVRTRA